MDTGDTPSRIKQSYMKNLVNIDMNAIMSVVR